MSDPTQTVDDAVVDDVPGVTAQAGRDGATDRRREQRESPDDESDAAHLLVALRALMGEAGAPWGCVLPVRDDAIGRAIQVWPLDPDDGKPRTDPAITHLTRPDLLFHAVIRQRQPFFVNRLTHGKLLGLPESHPTLSAFALLPWRDGQRVTALFCVANRPGGFAGPDVSRLQALLDLHALGEARVSTAALSVPPEVSMPQAPEPPPSPRHDVDRATARLDALTRLVPVGIVQLDTDWTCLYANDEWCALSGLTSLETLGTGWIDALHPDDVADSLHGLRDALSRGHSFDRELRLQTPLGNTVWVAVRATLLVTIEDRVNGMLVSFNDITERQRAGERLRRLAHHDALTGLLNRARFLERLGEVLQTRSTHESVVVLFIDLDGFKAVNDSLGHDVGDALLVAVAERLQADGGGQDSIARLGGDEFTLMFDGERALQRATDRANELVEQLRAPYRINDQEVYVSASIGIAASDADVHDTDMLIKRADLALYRAKEGGRSRVVVFTPELDRRRRHRSSLIDGLRRAVDQNEFTLDFQPQLLLEQQRLLGFEALLRWPGMAAAGVDAQAVVVALEEAGLIAKVGRWVIRQACSSWARWRSYGLIDEHTTMSVNVSVRQLGTAGFLAGVQQALREEGMPARCLIVEITESTLVKTSDSGIINDLKQLGVQISLDDFGTGYSSLAYLGQLPLDHLKIDRSFIRDLGHRPQAVTIVKSILALARELGIQAIAEGVEDPRVLPVLNRFGCAGYQGYQLSRPLDAVALERWLVLQTPMTLAHRSNFIDLGDARPALDDCAASPDGF